MKIGTVLFTYHRSRHTEEVLDALSKNDVLPEKLYIFQDGIKESTDCDEWEKVNELVKNINWCETEVHISKRNKGLAASVVAGINYVLKECDAVIVLEDDCVPYKQFMRFMVSALNTYRDKAKVYTVSGYAWDIDLPCSEEDAYFNGRNCTWGWGTWKDRWSQYEENYHVLKKIKSDKSTNEKLQVWGGNMEVILKENISGKCDSWAVFWGLKIIEKGGYCLSPYKSLIHNIGFDGSGVHRAVLLDNHLAAEMEYREDFKFPEKIECTKECEDEFCFLYGKGTNEEKMQAYFELLIQWVQMKQGDRNMHIPLKKGTGIAVYGKGKIFDCLLQEIGKEVEVKYIIESRPSIREYKGIPVISVRELPDNIKNVIVIPYYDLNIIRKKIERMRTDIELIGIDQLFQYYRQK